MSLEGAVTAIARRSNADSTMDSRAGCGYIAVARNLRLERRRLSDAEILGVLRSIDTRLGGVETRLEALENTTARQPDLRLIGHQMATLIERVTALEASNTRAIAALNDVARESVTPGEVEALHTEVTELRTSKFNHEVRLRQLEAELHITPSG